MEKPDYERILETVVNAHYRKPLINNVRRADYVEAMISLALGERWRLVSRDWDWAPWDLERDDGVRLEVKQSSAVQPWNTHDPQENRKFDIAHRNGYWDYESRWHAGKARYADIYLFAWHPELNRKIADHRCPEQWLFFVIPEHGLPTQKSISLNSLKKNPATIETIYEGLSATVETIATALPELKRNLLTAETEQRLERLVKETGRPKSFYFLEVIEKGIEDVEDYYRAYAVMERIRRGEDRIMTAAELSASLGLDS